MKIKQTIGTLIKLALAGACVYAYLNWDSIGAQNNDAKRFAESACADAIRKRFDAQSMDIYKIAENSNGYTVRAAAALPNDRRVKVVCLTTRQGGVRDISLEER